MTDITKILQLADGRRLNYLRYGNPEGKPFFYFHGIPGSRYESGLIKNQAVELNLSIIAIDRPGYGLSDFYPERSLLDWPQDVAAVADALGLEKFGIIGISGGGPYTLACAHVLADRLTSVGIICGLGPAFNLALLKEMSSFSRSVFSLERTSPRLFRLLYGLPLKIMAKISPRLTVRSLALLCGGLDRKILLGEDVLSTIAGNLSQAFCQGIEAAVQDIHLYQQPWGFELADIKTRIQLWHGTADPIVPALHSEFIAKHLPNATLTLVADAGHFSLPVLHANIILASLKKEFNSC